MKIHWAWYLFYSVTGVQAVATMLSNLLTLVSIIKFKYLRTAANVIIASLALSDFLHGLIIILNILALSFWNTKQFVCLTLFNFESLTVYVQFITYFLLAAERRISLRSVLKDKPKWTIKKVSALIVCGWGTVITLQTIMTVCSLNRGIPEGTRCEETMKYVPEWFAYTTYVFIPVMSLVIFITYGLVGWMVHTSNNQVTAHLPMNLQQQQRRLSNIKIASMMAMVFGVFFALYCPMIICVILITPTSPMWFYVLFYVTIAIYKINFWVNPFIFAWRDKNFKKAFKTILRPVWPTMNNPVAPN